MIVFLGSAAPCCVLRHSGLSGASSQHLRSNDIQFAASAQKVRPRIRARIVLNNRIAKKTKLSFPFFHPTG